LVNHLIKKIEFYNNIIVVIIIVIVFNNMDFNPAESSKSFLNEITQKIINNIKDKFKDTCFIDNNPYFNTIQKDDYTQNRVIINYNIFDKKFNGKLKYNIIESIGDKIENYKIFVKQSRVYFIKTSTEINSDNIKKINKTKMESNKYYFNICYYVNYTKTEYGYQISYESILVVSLNNNYIESYKKSGMNRFIYQNNDAPVASAPVDPVAPPLVAPASVESVESTEMTKDVDDIANILINLSNNS
jgi:hypothetical protein